MFNDGKALPKLPFGVSDMNVESIFYKIHVYSCILYKYMYVVYFIKYMLQNDTVSRRSWQNSQRCHYFSKIKCLIE